MFIPQILLLFLQEKKFTIHRTFCLHAGWLDQLFSHCPIFPTAASRRSRDRVSVPVWLVALSRQLLIAGLVGRYPANYLIKRTLIFDPRKFNHNVMPHRDVMGYYS